MWSRPLPSMADAVHKIDLASFGSHHTIISYNFFYPLSFRDQKIIQHVLRRNRPHRLHHPCRGKEGTGLSGPTLSPPPLPPLLFPATTSIPSYINHETHLTLTQLTYLPLTVPRTPLPAHRRSPKERAGYAVLPLALRREEWEFRYD